MSPGPGPIRPTPWKPQDAANNSTHVKACKHLDEHYGKLDILIHNAGVWRESTNSSSYLPGANINTGEVVRRTTTADWTRTIYSMAICTWSHVSECSAKFTAAVLATLPTTGNDE